ncbi:MAG: type IV pili methyl-accepting chemotaxis transducer N-terminal domain-containing protein [Cyclobacteriaceae bacterium]
MPNSKFYKLGFLYLLALSCIALSIVVSQLLIQQYISDQSSDARVVNIAGRQRMLSQKITKCVLLIKSGQDASTELAQSLGLWEKSHQGLQHGDSELGLPGGNSTNISQKFEELAPYFQEIVHSAHTVLQNDSDSVVDRAVERIRLAEPSFLKGMDAIVFQYDDEARKRVESLSKIEYILLSVSLGIILLEYIFIFRPIARSIRQSMVELKRSEESSKTMAADMSKLYNELVRSYQDLEAVNLQPAAPVLVASLNKQGIFTFIADHFVKLMEWPPKEVPHSILDLLTSNGYQSNFIQSVLKLVNDGSKWSGEFKLTTYGGDFIWLDVNLIPVSKGPDIHIVARDVTEFKEAKIRSREINEEKVAATVKEQQFRSVLILEGQEEERNRLSRELHDGVGQMLTALKLNTESITLANSVHARKRLDETKNLIRTIIREVRRVSFNIKPNSLTDFGLIPALQKLCEHVSGLSNVEVGFENRTGFITRLDSHIENNIYRIVQEAVNNALKYSKAKQVTVGISHSSHHLSIFIADDGVGFDYKKLQEQGHFSKAGHGIFNMKERIAFVGGTFEIDTSKNKGTTINLELPLAS